MQKKEEHLARVTLLEHGLKVAQADAHLFKQEADLYSNSLSELNSRFSTLENLKRAAEGKTQALQE